MTERKTTDFHWKGEALMAREFGEVVEICTVDWSGLDEFEAEHKALLAAASDLFDALEAGEALIAGDLVGSEWKQACRAFLKDARAAIAKAEAAQ